VPLRSCARPGAGGGRSRSIGHAGAWYFYPGINNALLRGVQAPTVREVRLSAPDNPESTEVANVSLLLDSAYDFVEHSLEEAYVATEEQPRRWKFAIIDIATAVELFLKERLRREHPVLIYTKVDDGSGHTVSLDLALKRLLACKVTIDQEDISRLNRARDIRNSIVHFSTQATAEQLRAAFVDLFEFAHGFHLRELGDELHDHISEEYWDPEASFIEEFRQEYVSYHGEMVHREWPKALVDAQYFTHWIIDGVPFRRVPFGDRREGWGEAVPPRPCHDCAALSGQLHGPDCDCDCCPKCGGQSLSCCCGEERELGMWPDEVSTDE